MSSTDEIYEHILYDGLEHIHMAGLPGMWERTVTISGISKTYSATDGGWVTCRPPRPHVGHPQVHMTTGSSPPPTPPDGAVGGHGLPILLRGSRSFTGSAGIFC